MEHLGSSSLSPPPCTVPSLLAVPKTDPVQVLAGVSNESKSQVLDFIQLQSNVNIFAAKYPGANIICGVELEGSNEFRWQTYGPQAANPEVRKIILPLAENEIRTHRRGGTGSPSCKYNIIKSFIDAAALAGVIAGVQVTLLLELAMKLCDSGESIRTEGPSGRGADPLSGVPAGPMDGMSQFQQLAALRTSPTPTPTTTSTKGIEGGSAKKPRFTPEQAASLVEAIQQHYVQHPSRYTELVIKDMKERYPGIDLDSAAVRKFKFKILLKHSRNEGDSGSNRLDSGRNQLGTGEGTRSQDTPRKKSRVDVLECKALDAADGLVGLGMEEGHEMTNISESVVLGRDKDTNYGASGMETQRLEFLSRAAEELACDPNSTSQGGTRGGDPSKRKRLSPEQMAALIACVKEHVVKCPERYTQVVMKEMTDRFPGLELNMGQIRKVKFRALGNQRRGGAQDEGELTDGGLEASTSGLEGIPYNHLAGLGLGELKPSGQFSQGSLLQYKDLESFLLHANPHLGLGLCNISLPPNVHSLTQALTLLPGGPGPLETNPVPLPPLSTCHQAMQEGPIEMSTHQGNGQQQEPYGESPVRGFPPSPAACGEADGSGFRRASLSQDVDVDALDNQHCEADVAQHMT